MKTLVLNSNFLPLSIISQRRAVVLEMKSKTTVLSYYDKVIKSTAGEILIPAVMLLNRYIKTRPVVRQPSKKNIRTRDGNLCGYCGIILDSSNFTVDHIIPSSRFKNKGASNTWENLISCCKPCNNHKGNRTPEQANMRLLKQPKKPNSFFFLEEIPEEWEQFIKIGV